MANDEINEYVDSAVVPHNLAEFDMDNWTGSVFLSTRIKWQDIQAAVTGLNLSNSNLASTDAVRTFTLLGNTDAEQLAFKNSDGFNSLVINGAGDAFNHGLQGVTTNTVFGLNTGRLITGGSTTVFGASALEGITTGSNLAAFGYNAGKFELDGVTLLTTNSRSTFFGEDTRALSNGGVNENVIGYAAIGKGDNSTVLGNSSIANSFIYGLITAPSYSGAGDRNIVADPSGQFKIGTAAASLIVHGVTLASFPGVGSTESIYIADDTDFMYIWDTDSSAYKKVGNEDIYNADGQLSDNIRNLNLKLDTAAATLDFRNLSGNSIIKLDGLRDIYLDNLKAPTGNEFFIKIDDSGKLSAVDFSTIDTYVDDATFNPVGSILTLSHNEAVPNVTVDLSVLDKDTFYTADGSLFTDRTILSSGTTSIWDGGNIATKSNGIGDNGFLVLDSFGVTKAELGFNVSLSSATLELIDASGSYFSASDGFVGIGGATQDSAEILGLSDSILVKKAGAGELLRLNRSSDGIDRLNITDNASIYNSITHTFGSIGASNANIIVDGNNSPNIKFTTNTFADTLQITGGNRPTFTSLNSGQMAISTTLGTAFGINGAITPEAMVHIEGANDLAGASALLAKDNSGVMSFDVQNDGVCLFRSFTLATLPAVTSGGQIFVSDATGASLTGSMCFSNGTVWIDQTTGLAVA